MKNVKLILLAATVSVLTLQIACKKSDTTTPPVILALKAGLHDGTTKIKRGQEFGVDFKAESRNVGKLDKYHIEIHDHPASAKVEDEYRIIDSTFVDNPKFKGTRNATVHHHITVPANANLGDYHVVIVVFDEYGNTADTEDGNVEIKVIE